MGVTSVLLVGILLGYVLNHYEVPMDSKAFSIIKELGLSLVIYLIWLSVGPFFFRQFRKWNSLLYNGLAVLIVTLSVLFTWLIHIISNVDIAIMTGIYTGSVGSTPGMIAASALSPSESDSQLSSAFAVTYFIGTFLPIICITLLRRIFKIEFENEKIKTAKTNEQGLVKYMANSERINYRSIILLSGGLTAGILFGCLKLKVLGLTFGVGSTLGVLLVGIIVGFAGPRLKLLDISLTNNKFTIMLREFGVALFLAAIGLEAGKGLSFDWTWILYSVIVSFIPIFFVGCFARKKLKMNFFLLPGLLCGSTTDTPALAFAERMNNGIPNSLPATVYASVYPLTLVLRVITAQLIVMNM